MRANSILLTIVLGGGERARRLGGRRLVLGLVGQVDEDARFLGRLELGVEAIDRRLEARLLAQRRLGLLG